MLCSNPLSRSVRERLRGEFGLLLRLEKCIAAKKIAAETSSILLPAGFAVGIWREHTRLRYSGCLSPLPRQLDVRFAPRASALASLSLAALR